MWSELQLQSFQTAAEDTHGLRSPPFSEEGIIIGQTPLPGQVRGVHLEETLGTQPLAFDPARGIRVLHSLPLPFVSHFCCATASGIMVTLSYRYPRVGGRHLMLCRKSRSPLCFGRRVGGRVGRSRVGSIQPHPSGLR